jgi:hypothetical protein
VQQRDVLGLEKLRREVSAVGEPVGGIRERDTVGGLSACAALVRHKVKTGIPRFNSVKVVKVRLLTQLHNLVDV